MLQTFFSRLLCLTLQPQLHLGGLLTQRDSSTWVQQWVCNPGCTLDHLTIA